MKMYEIFPNYHKIYLEDAEVAIRNANNKIATAKKEKKQAEIGKAKQSLSKKQGDLQRLVRIS